MSDYSVRVRLKGSEGEVEIALEQTVKINSPHENVDHVVAKAVKAYKELNHAPPSQS